MIPRAENKGKVDAFSKGIKAGNCAAELLRQFCWEGDFAEKRGKQGPRLMRKFEPRKNGGWDGIADISLSEARAEAKRMMPSTSPC